MNLFGVVLCGGVGSRLWPLSRRNSPKQFSSVVGGKSLLADTLVRLSKICLDGLILVGSEESRFHLQNHIAGSKLDSSIVLEPDGRNTAPAIALAALKIIQSHGDGLMLVSPADHVIPDVEAFSQQIQSALDLAGDNFLITFGVVPVAAETGFGYIRAGIGIANGFHVSEFVEKPEQNIADQFFASGNYYWNSGVFMFKASVYLSALERLAPDVFRVVSDSFANGGSDGVFFRPKQEIFSSVSSISIDHAVLEHSTVVVVVPLDIEWSDAGSWSSVWDVSTKDINENVSKGDVILKSTTGSYVNSTSRLVVVVGLKDVAVVETADAVLVMDRQSSQSVKDIYNALNDDCRSEAVNHRHVYRPWGMYDSVESGDRYQVKRIRVDPGARLSLQMHYHRAEHWIVVAGTAKVSINGQEKILTENESIYIPIGAMHFLENPGKIPLDLIEVQSGAYLGEDDIIRFDDKYGRV